MQPTLFIFSGVPGLVYVNGRMAGEVDAERALTLPVCAYGAVYLEHRALAGEYLPLARRLTLSGGLPVISGAADGALSIVSWPGGVLEAELAPASAQPPRYASVPNTDFVYRSGATPCLTRGDMRIDLPEGALAPREARAFGGFHCVLGDLAEGGGYAAWTDGKTPARSCARAEWTPSGDLRLLCPSGDVVGHARLEIWRAGSEGAYLAGEESLWEMGAPRWPDTPENTAIAAAQAAILGLWDEAMGYVRPDARSGARAALEKCAEWSGCLPMKFPVPDGRPAVAMYRARAANWVETAPLYYGALPGGGQGVWQLDKCAFSPD